MQAVDRAWQINEGGSNASYKWRWRRTGKIPLSSRKQWNRLVDCENDFVRVDESWDKSKTRLIA
jgi:hypothetical protein